MPTAASDRSSALHGPGARPRARAATVAVGLLSALLVAPVARAGEPPAAAETTRVISYALHRMPGADAPHTDVAAAWRAVRRLPGGERPSVLLPAGRLPYDLRADGTLLVPVPGADRMRRVTAGERLAVDLGGGRSAVALFERRLFEWTATSGDVAVANVDGVAIAGVDRDGDGRFFTPFVDGVLLDGSGREAPAPPVLVTPRGQYNMREEGDSLALDPAPGRGVAPDHLAAAWRVNLARSRLGLPPVVVDPALSADGNAHAAYLRRNAAWLAKQVAAGNFTAGHEERDDRPGFTEAGRRAAPACLIAFDTGSHEAAVAEWMATFYHRPPLLEPDLARVGFGEAEGVRVMDVRRGRATRPEAIAAGRAAGDPAGGGRALVWPAPGAEAVPRGFNPKGEAPRPFTSDGPAAAKGYPITFAFIDPVDRRAVKVERFHLALAPLGERGETGDPLPGTLLDADGPLRAYGSPVEYGFVPDAPLEAGRGYEAVATFERRGDPVTFRWRFAAVANGR